MRALTLLLIVLLTLTSATVAQQYAGLQTTTYTISGSGACLNLTGSGIQYHTLTWNVTGTLNPVTTVKLEQAASCAGAWSDLIAATNATSNGASPATSGTVNAVRVTTVIGAGGGTLTVTWVGYRTLPIGSVGPFTFTGGNPILTVQGTYTDPLANNVEGIFVNRIASGDHTGTPGTAAADLGIFTFLSAVNIHDTSQYYEFVGGEFEANASGTGVNIPNNKWISLGAQTFVHDSGTDSVVIPTAIDVLGRGPYKWSLCDARVGTADFTNGSATVVGHSSDFAVADQGKPIFAGIDATGVLNNAQTFGTVLTRNAADNITLSSAWTGPTRLGVNYRIPAAGSTGPCGSTSDITAAYGGFFKQPYIGTYLNLGVFISADVPEASPTLAFDATGGQRWSIATAANSIAQSHNFQIGNTVAGKMFEIGYPVAGNASTHIRSAGTGDVVINGMVAGTGEGPVTNGTGILIVKGGAGIRLDDGAGASYTIQRDAVSGPLKFTATQAAFSGYSFATNVGTAITINNDTSVVLGKTTAPLYNSSTNCSSSASPAVCAAAPAGSFVIAAGATTVVVNTTAVTANSQVLLTEDSSLGTKLSVTCNTQSLLVLGTPKVTARTGGTSFTAAIEVAPTTNPMCVSYFIMN